MAVDDVWGNSWLSSWGTSWATATVAVVDTTPQGGAGHPVYGRARIYWQNLKKRKPQVYDNAKLFRSVEKMVYELVHPTDQPVRRGAKKQVPALGSDVDTTKVSEALARMAVIAQGDPELDARLIQVRAELAYLLEILEDDAEVLMLI